MENESNINNTITQNMIQLQFHWREFGLSISFNIIIIVSGCVINMNLVIVEILHFLVEDLDAPYMSIFDILEPIKNLNFLSITLHK